MGDNICPCCGQILESGVKFCTFCGTPVNEDESVKTPVNSEETSDKVAAESNVYTQDKAYDEPVTPSISFTKAEETDDKKPQFTTTTVVATPPDMNTNTYTPPAYVPPVDNNTRFNNTDIKPPKKSKYAPMSTIGYIGCMILFAVPVIGWIFAIVWACGGTKNINRRHYARAVVIMALINIMLVAGACALFKNIFINYNNKYIESYNAIVETVENYL